MIEEVGVHMVKEVKAAVMVKPGLMEMRTFPYPKVEEDSAVVRMEMSGICGTDKHMYSGKTKHGLGGKGGTETTFPIIPGHENVGVIDRIGSKAARTMEIEGEILKEGDRIFPVNDVLCGHCYYCRNTWGYPLCENWMGYGVTISCRAPPHLFGGWAEYMYLLPKVTVSKVPEGLPSEVAVLTEPMTVAYGTFLKAMQPYPMIKEGFDHGDSVVVQGAGPLGIVHIAMAKMIGAGEIIAVEPGLPQSEFRLRLAKEIGADDTVNLKDSKERVEEVRRLTDGRGADLAIEVAGASAIPEGLEMLRKGGTLVEMANYIDTGATITISPYRHIAYPSLRIISNMAWPYQGSGRTMRLMKRFLDRIPLHKIVTHKFAIEEAEKGIKASMREDVMKAVITSKA